MLTNFEYSWYIYCICYGSQCSVAKPVQQFGHAMQINLNHYSFLLKLIPYAVYKHRKFALA